MIRDQELFGTSTGNSMDFSLGDFGSPGTPGSFTVVPRIEGEIAGDDQKLSDSSERYFTCFAQLIREMSLKPQINGAFTAEDGGSFLSPPAGATALTINTNRGNVDVQLNQSNELSLITMKIRSVHIVEASKTFYTSIVPLLDHLSYVANVPVRVGMIRVHDEKHGIQQISFTNPFQQMVINNHLGAVRADLEPVYVLYREARNSDSPYYRLLCHYKILDGVSKMKGQILKKAMKRGVIIEPPKDTVPDHANLAQDLREHVGKSVRGFQSAVLTRRFRDAVAHFGLSDRSVLQVSSPEEFALFTDAAFAAELCVRVVVENYVSLTRSIEAKLQQA